MQNRRLIEVVNHLPPGAKLSTTTEFEQVTGYSYRDVSILQACNIVLDVGYAESGAEVSPDGKMIRIYAGGKRIPWSAFTIEQEPKKE